MTQEEPRSGDVVLGENSRLTPQNNDLVLGGIDRIKHDWNHAKLFIEKLEILQRAFKSSDKREAIALALSLTQELIVRKTQIWEQYQARKSIAFERINRGQITNSEYYQLDWLTKSSRDKELQDVYQKVLCISNLVGAIEASRKLAKVLVEINAPINVTPEWKLDLGEKGLSLLILHLSGESSPVVNKESCSFQCTDFAVKANPMEEIENAIARIRMSPVLSSFQSLETATQALERLGAKVLKEEVNPAQEASPKMLVKKEKSQFLQGVEKLLKKGKKGSRFF